MIHIKKCYRIIVNNLFKIKFIFKILNKLINNYFNNNLHKKKKYYYNKLNMFRIKIIR